MLHLRVCAVITDDAQASGNQEPLETPVAQAKPKKRNRQTYRSPAVRISMTALRIVLFGYAAILVLLVLMETRLVYPGAYFGDSIAPHSASYPQIETVQYSTTDGITLQGRLIERAQASDVVLFFHGNGEKAKWLDEWLVLLSDEFDATVMVAEYRGFDDEATPTEKGVLADCFSARDYLCGRCGKSPSEIILYGRSLGGGCAVAIASLGGAKALVLDRTFDRLVDVAADKYPFVPVNFLMRNRYDSAAKLTVYRGPLVQLHGTTDEIIPIHQGQALFAAAPSPKKHWIPVEGLGHNDSLPLQSLRTIVAKVREFTNQQRQSP